MTWWRFSCAKARTSGQPTPPDVITYRYNEELVYVPVAANYNQALSHVRDAFPQLRNLRDASLSLTLTSPQAGHDGNFVSISAPAWPKLIAHMSRYQIIDVHATQEKNNGGTLMSIPKITITFADTVDETKEGGHAPPPYQKEGWLFRKLHKLRH